MWSFISPPGGAGLVPVPLANLVGGGDGCRGGRGGSGGVHGVAAAEGDELAPVRAREVQDLVFCGGLGHVYGPDVHGQGLAVYDGLSVDIEHWRPGLRVADPDGGREPGRVADVPGVGELLARAGLAGGGASYLAVEVVVEAGRATQDDLPQDLRGGGGLVAGEDAVPFDLVVVDGLALAESGEIYPLDSVGLPVDAAGGEGRVGGGHLKRAHARPQTPDGSRGVGVYRGGDAHGRGDLGHVLQPQVHGELYKDRVVRLGHGPVERYPAPLYAVVVADLDPLPLVVEVQVLRQIVSGFRRDELPERRREHERLEGAPRLAAGVQGQVEVVFLAGQGLYGSVLGLDARDGAGGVTGFVQGLLYGVHRLLLKGGVEGGVDV